MITATSFTEEWIEASLKKQGITPDKNKYSFAEKMNHALLLAELLVINQLDFIFKGGTSLILLLDSPQRFSIDIDIITKTSKEEIEKILEKICQNSRFTHFEIDERRDIGVPKIHYHLFFEPQFANSANDNKVLLDIIFSENPYPQIQAINLAKDWIHTSEPLTVIKLPTIESITGDKLTASAPTTTGILYRKGKQSEIIKQMFDLGQLFDKIENFKMVADAFYQNVTKEIDYRQLSISPNEVLDDIWQTCFDVIDCFDKKESKHQELMQGIKSFGAWTIHPFRKENAFEISGKIAYMIAKIKQADYEPLKKFDSKTMKISDFLIQEQSFNFLNKKVKNAHYALFYWYKAISIIPNLSSF
jgi:hypothetical protein